MNLSNRSAALFLCLYLALLAALSLLAVPFKPRMIVGGDKAVHLAMYLPLGFLLGILKLPLPPWIKFLVCLFAGALYGGSMELLQSAVPGRTASWCDELANILGLGIGIAVGHLKSQGQISSPLTS
jgi:VanZ family protein